MYKTILKEKLKKLSDVYSKMGPAFIAMTMDIAIVPANIATLRYEKSLNRLKTKTLLLEFEEEFDSERWCNELDSVGYGWSVFY